MRVALASVAARAGRVNEDFAGAVPMGAVVIDGAGIPGTAAICRHGVAWYAARLGGALLGLLPAEAGRSLPELLAAAVEQVTDAHRETCDVADPISPSATVAVLRRSGDRVDYLVLGDVVVVLDRVEDEPFVVTDPREVVIGRRYESMLAGLAPGSDDHRRILAELRSHRNRPGGFWLAKDDPRAAGEAITGSCPVAGLAGAVLLSNGAGRIVDPLRLTGWPGVLTLLAEAGPAEVIRLVRRAEARAGLAADDATVVRCTALDEA